MTHGYRSPLSSAPFRALASTLQQQRNATLPKGSGQRAAGSGQRAAGSGQRAAGSGQRAAGSGQRAAAFIKKSLLKIKLP
ncbi:hypothetical protein [Zymobacter sp. IVIA_5232.4 C2]|uniref:hypothetical protein n=1 Tax=Zymobacter sp. IVIA_5232.4 C2 TaxID=3394855 RepID=UPI0039C06A03